ncbi:tetratricopeptide repeat protein [Streptomyces sp. NPDC088729]|uniref:tetratricopeptide repeat protein n=1 Tax=Streptomyces sp. NPDC088729 TaxID=3365876 RepID=UPI0038096650
MSNRFSLVIAAQWDASGRDLDDLEREARLLDANLRDDDRGGCLPAHADGVLLGPRTVETLRSAVASAFAHATLSAEDGPATLVLAFLGHGFGVRHDDFLFPVVTSPAIPDPETAYSVPSGLRDGLTRHGDVRALAVMIDACQSGVAVLTAAKQWFPASMERGREIGLVTSASGDQPAFGLSFVRGVNQILQRGHARLGTELYDEDLRWAAGRKTRGQLPQVIRHGGMHSGDTPGRPHWIARNVAFSGAHSVLADSDVGKEQLGRLRLFQPPEPLPEIIRTVGAHRAVAVVGRRGYGKSVLAAALCRPELLPDGTHVEVAALRELTQGDMDEPVLTDIARQLRTHLPGFDDARTAFCKEVPAAVRNDLQPEHRLVTEPLDRCRAPAAPVRVVVDALDQLHPTQRVRIIDALNTLARDTPPWFGVVVTSRDGLELPADWIRIAMPPASLEQLNEYVRLRVSRPERRTHIVEVAGGNWQTARLWADAGSGRVPVDGGYTKAFHQARESAPGGAKQADAVLNVLGAVGRGPVLPRPLLLRSAALRGGPRTDVVLDQVLELLAGLLSRVPESRVGEMLGVDHQTMVDHMTTEDDRLDLTDGHRSLAEALDSMAPMDQHDPGDPLHAYARDSEPLHLWHIENYERLLESLSVRASSDAAANRDRLLGWCERLAERPGPGSPVTLRARQQAAYWAGRAGSYSRARSMYEAVLADQTRFLEDPGHPDILETRHRIAYATGQMGRFAEAVELHQDVLAEQTRTFGADDRRTMESRHHIAYWTGRGGAMAEGLRLHEQLLPEQIRALGATHKDVLESRHYIAYWYGRLGHPEEALAMHAQLLQDRVAAFGQDHEQVVFSRMNICKFTCEAGRFRAGLADYRRLLPAVERVKGVEHPDSLLVRLSIARYTWELGDTAAALPLHEELLSDQRKVNGEHHPTVLITRNNLAWIRGELGDPARALRELTALREERVEAYGRADHPEVLTTRLGMGWWTAENGDLPAAIRELRSVAADRAAALSDGTHPDVLDARSRLGELLFRSADGDGLAEAVKLLAATETEQTARVGDLHPHTLATRARLATALLETGRPAEARALLARLLPQQEESLGPHHPATLRTGERLSAL